MKVLGIILMTAVLAFAPGYGSAQQPAEKGKFPTPQPTPEAKFPTGSPPAEGKFPTGQAAPEGKAPEAQPVEKGKLQPAPAIMDQKIKGGKAEPAKNLSPSEKEYLKKTAADLATLQKKIDALKVKKEFRTIQRKRANMMLMVDLQRRSLNARKQFAALEKAPDSAWSGRKTEMGKTMDDLKKTYSDILQFFE
jgi:hypothetical protein